MSSWLQAPADVLLEEDPHCPLNRRLSRARVTLDMIKNRKILNFIDEDELFSTYKINLLRGTEEV
jgi:hypothetical protein